MKVEISGFGRVTTVVFQNNEALCLNQACLQLKHNEAIKVYSTGEYGLYIQHIGYIVDIKPNLFNRHKWKENKYKNSSCMVNHWV